MTRRAHQPGLASWCARVVRRPRESLEGAGVPRPQGIAPEADAPVRPGARLIVGPAAGTGKSRNPPQPARGKGHALAQPVAASGRRGERVADAVADDEGRLRRDVRGRVAVLNLKPPFAVTAGSVEGYSGDDGGLVDDHRARARDAGRIRDPEVSGPAEGTRAVNPDLSRRRRSSQATDSARVRNGYCW